MSKALGQRTLADLAFIVLLCAALTSSWVAVSPFPIQLVDMFLAVSVPLVIIHLLSVRATPKIPVWMAVGASTIAVVLAGHIFWATSYVYMASRAVLANVGVSSSIWSSTIPGLQWLVALLVLPILVSVATGGDARRVSLFMHAWMLGVVISSAVAIADFTGLTSINYSMTGTVNATGRESGLTIHPNNLGISAAITLPVAVYYATRSRFWGPVCVIVVAAGAFLSGSRAAQVGVVLAFLLTAVLLRRFWRVTLRLLAWASVTMLAIRLTGPDIFNRALSLVRFSSDTAQSSDFGRDILAEQGILDFQHRPFVGVGFEVVNAAHSIYLQALAAGGLVLAIGMTTYFIGALLEAWQVAKLGDPMGRVVFTSLLTWLALGAFSNQLTDRYLYFGIAALVALWSISPKSRPNLSNGVLQSRPTRLELTTLHKSGSQLLQEGNPPLRTIPEHQLEI